MLIILFLSRCPFDYVEFHDGGTHMSRLIGSRLCGSSLPGTIVTTENVMFVRFRTDNSIAHAGFKARYSIGEYGDNSFCYFRNVMRICGDL